MSEQIFSNAVILTGKDLEIAEGYLVVRDGAIDEIGEGDPPKSGTDLNRGFVLPPFVNAHTHLGDSVRKEIYLGKEQPEVVGPDGVKFDFLHSSSKESKIRAIRSSARDMIRTGTIAYCDFREGGVEGAEILRAANPPTIRAVVLSRPTRSDEITKLLRNSDGIGLPSLDSFEEEEVKMMARETKRSDKLFAIHVAETEEAQKKSEESTGRTEVERALELDPSFLVHGTWATEEDIEAMRRKDVPLVVCGRSNNLLCTGDPPLKTAVEKGVEIWIGTDNATVCQPDIFRELSFLWAALRLQDSKAGPDEARELLKAATINPNSVLGLPFGPIEEGANAAFTVLSRDENLQRLDDLYTGLVNRARPDNIRTLFCPS